MNQPPQTERNASSPDPLAPAGRLIGVVLTLVIVELTAATANIHFGLGGTLFTLNGIGYVALATAYAAGALLPIGIIRRFGWLPRIALAAYTITTIVAYLTSGGYFTLGWIAKGIELAIVGLILVDLLNTYGSPSGLRHAVVESIRMPGPRGGPRAA